MTKQNCPRHNLFNIILLLLYISYFVSPIPIDNIDDVVTTVKSNTISKKSFSVEGKLAISNGTNEVTFHQMNRQQLRSFFANLLKERTQKLLKNNERNKNNSVILTVKNKKLPTTKKNKIFSDWDPKTSRIVCQFFIFGTLFGVVCSISACTCLLQPKNNNRQQVMPRLSIAPPTLDDTKPIRIQFGDDGFCYARSLEESEVPPLPDYNSALSLPTNVISSLQSQMIEIGLIEDKKVNNYI